METQYFKSNISRYTHAAALGLAIAASFASGLVTGINKNEKENAMHVAEAHSIGVLDGIKISRHYSTPFEEKSINGRKWYSISLEGKVKPGNYQLVTEESDVCGILSENVEIKPGNYQLMFIEPVKQLDKAEKNPNYKPGTDKPLFYSTTPIFTYPDGKIEAYNPLREGENLEEVMKKGPVQTFVPEKESSK
ncbi:Uncharacterised protein [uncultured archaeon]|nr:Uncharacterised protein [uncultured archaeon]